MDVVWHRHGHFAFFARNRSSKTTSTELILVQDSCKSSLEQVYSSEILLFHDLVIDARDKNFQVRPADEISTESFKDVQGSEKLLSQRIYRLIRPIPLHFEVKYNSLDIIFNKRRWQNQQNNYERFTQTQKLVLFNKLQELKHLCNWQQGYAACRLLRSFDSLMVQWA